MNSFIKDIIIDYLCDTADHSTDLLCEAESILTGTFGRTPVRAASSPGLEGKASKPDTTRPLQTGGEFSVRLTRKR